MTEQEKINGWTFEETVKTAENLMEVEQNMFKWDVLRHLRDFAENYKHDLEQYTAIGTVDEIKSNMEELKRWHMDTINPNIKNVFAYTSTSICHNCDHKDEYIEELEAEMEQYRAIGTQEECREAVEKMKPKRPDECEDRYYACPVCDNILLHKWIKYPTKLMPKTEGLPHCMSCGQAIDWSDEE